VNILKEGMTVLTVDELEKAPERIGKALTDYRLPAIEKRFWRR
jgi:hypothetical protein